MMKNKTFNLLLTTIGCFGCNFMHAEDYVRIACPQEGTPYLTRTYVQKILSTAPAKKVLSTTGKVMLDENVTWVLARAFACTPMRKSDEPSAQLKSVIMEGAKQINAKKKLAIGKGAFANCNQLEDVDLFYTTYIGPQAFMGCKSLQVANFPCAEYIHKEAFKGCPIQYACLYGGCEIEYDAFFLPILWGAGDVVDDRMYLDTKDHMDLNQVRANQILVEWKDSEYHTVRIERFSKASLQRWYAEHENDSLYENDSSATTRSVTPKQDG